MRCLASIRRGFTLIEVLVSLAIFALAAVVLSATYLNILGSYRALAGRQQTEEDWKWLRLSVLTEPDRQKIEAGGKIGLPDAQEMQWTATIEPTDVADLFRVGLSAEAGAANGREPWKREQSFLVLRPAWSDPSDRDKLRDNTRQRLAKERQS